MEVAINKVEAGAGIEWLKGGWDLFVKSWLIWLVAAIVCLVLFVILNFIPIIGQLLVVVLSSTLGVVANLALKEVSVSGVVNWENVFTVTKTKLVPILILALINVGLMVLSMIMVGIFVGGGALLGGLAGEASVGGAIVGGVLSVIITMLFGLVIAVANIFAVPLIALTDHTAFDALKASIRANFSNIIPMIVYGVMLMILFFIGSMLFGVGLLVVIPVSFGANFVAARALFPAINF